MHLLGLDSDVYQQLHMQVFSDYFPLSFQDSVVKEPAVYIVYVFHLRYGRAGW